MLADTEAEPPDGNQDQRCEKNRRHAHGDAQRPGRQVVRTAVLIGGVDQDDQRSGGRQDQGRGAAGVPEAVQTGEGQGGEESPDQHGQDQQQPGQQHQGDGAHAPDQAVADIRQLDGRGEGEARQRQRKPGLLQEIAEEAQADDVEQRRAKEQQQPEGPREGDRQGQLDPGHPSDVEIGGIGGEQTPLKVRRDDQMMGDEQGRCPEGHQAEGQLRALAGGLAGDVVQGQQRKDGSGDGGPDPEGPQPQPTHRGEQDQRQVEGHDQQWTEHGRLGRGPGGRAALGRLEQPVERHALDQPDAQSRQPDGPAISGLAQRAAARGALIRGLCRHGSPPAHPGGLSDLKGGRQGSDGS